MESILTSIKKLLGPFADHEEFDPEIIMHINSVLMDLNQMGIGPSEGFSIEDETTTWSEFIPVNDKFEAVKTYIYLRVKLLFDPPTSSAVIKSMERDIERYEFRLTVAADEATYNDNQEES